MYIDVHMTMTVNITDFRKNLFKYADLIRKGYEIDVEKVGQTILRAVPPKIPDRVARARKALKLLKELGGKFPDWEYDADKVRRNKVEMEYMKNLDKKMKW